MARVRAYASFDIDAFDLNEILEEGDSVRFFDNQPKSLDGTSYQDRLAVASGTEVINFAGASISYNASQEVVTGGTVQAIVGVFGGTTVFGVHGLSLSAVGLFEAALSPSTSDDLALIRAAFAGADSFVLSGQDDRARGFGGNDSMSGRDGNDRLHGDGGNDRLFGGNGADRLHAGTGADTLTGGRGRDELFGGTDTGSGSGDDFVFGSRRDSAVGANRDVIRNFTTGRDDIDLRGIDARAGTPDTNDAFRWNDDNGGKAHHVWWTSTAEGAILRGDVTGDTAADFEIRVAGTSSTTLASGDVLL